MPPRPQLTAYDEGVLRELLAWKQPRSTRRGRAADRIDATLDSIATFIPTARLEAILGLVMPRAARLSELATSEALVLRAYHRAGHGIGSVRDVEGLPLSAADSVARKRKLTDSLVAGGEGAFTGFFGGPAIVADVAAVMLMSLRTVQSRCLVYGFDPAKEEELAFSLQVIDAASQLGPNGKRVSREAVLRFAAKESMQSALKSALTRLPPKVAARTAALKAESVVPVIGAVTGAGFNAAYIDSIARTARMAYRERFLGRRYGEELLRAYGL